MSKLFPGVTSQRCPRGLHLLVKPDSAAPAVPLLASALPPALSPGLPVPALAVPREHPAGCKDPSQGHLLLKLLGLSPDGACPLNSFQDICLAGFGSGGPGNVPQRSWLWPDPQCPAA